MRARSKSLISSPEDAPSSNKQERGIADERIGRGSQAREGDPARQGAVVALAEAVIQAYADDYTAGSLRQPSDVEVAAALRYLLRQGLLREGITIMAAKFAVAGMCSAMAEALEKEES